MTPINEQIPSILHTFSSISDTIKVVHRSRN
jgi:hypothetical protein